MIDSIDKAQQQNDQTEEKTTLQLSQSDKSINFYFCVFTKQHLARKEIEAANPGAPAIFDRIDHKCWAFTDEGAALRVAALTKDGEVKRIPNKTADILLYGSDKEKAQLKIENSLFEKWKKIKELETILDGNLNLLGIDKIHLEGNPPGDFSENQRESFIKCKELNEDIKKLEKSRESLEENIKPKENLDRSKFNFKSIASLLQEPSKIDWLIKDYLDAESLAVLFGEPGGMKSFLALDLGLCISTGLKWHGSQIRKTGSVFYIAGEGHRGLNRRLKAWTQSKNIKPDAIPFFVSNKSMQVLETTSVAEVVGCIEELKSKYGNPVLIIIDTLNRNFGSGDENSTKDMTEFVSNIDNHIKSRFNCAVLIVHHTPLNDANRARGSTSLLGAIDWQYSLQKSGTTRTLIPIKAKDHELPPKLSFIPQSIELDGWLDDEDGTPLNSCVLQKCTNEINLTKESKSLKGINKIALDCLVILTEKKNTNKIYIEEWREACYEAGISPSVLADSKKKAFQRALKYLRDEKHIEYAGSDYWRLAGTGQSANEEKFVQGEFFKD